MAAARSWLTGSVALACAAATLAGYTEVVGAHRQGRHPVLADLTLPDGTASITARSPLRWGGEHGPAGEAPELGRDTDEVLAEVLGLGAAEIGGLHDRGVVG